MKKKRLRIWASVLMAGSLLFSSLPASQLSVQAASNSYETAENPTLRDYADPSVSYIGWGMGADNFADENMDTFWNGHNDQNLSTTAQWMMYDFGEKKATVKGSEILFYDDGGGVIAPAGVKVETSLDGKTWTEVTKKGEWTIKKNEVSTIEFEPVEMSKIRVTMIHTEQNNTRMPVAVKDWKLLGDIPDSFPKPEVIPPEEPSEDLKLTDAAIYAVPSAHYTSAWETIDGINNAEFEPVKSDDGTGKGWGNWPQSAGTKCWVQYDWGEKITTKTFQVYWYGSEAGMKIPKDVNFQYKDDNGEWQQAALVSHSKNFSKYNQYNQITIEPVTTTAIRMNMTVTGDCCGIYRWKVYSDISNDFAAAAALAKVQIPEVREGRVFSGTTKKLSLPKDALNGKVSLTWKSKTPNVVSDDGTIKAPAENTDVTLEATAAVSGTDVKKTKDFTFQVMAEKVTEYAMTIDPKKNKGVDISQQLYGVFYEDINSAADGGLASELVKNNSFENYQNKDEETAPEVKGDQDSWKLHWKSTKASGFVVERTAGLNDTNTNYAKISGSQKLTNHGFVRKDSMDKSAMGIRSGTEYAFSMFVKADSSYPGTVKVQAVNDSGEAVTDQAALSLKKDGTWQKVTAKLKGTKTELGTLELSFEGAKDSDAIYIDMVSLVPTDGYGYGDKNFSYGAGLRKDLVQKLVDLHPQFIRFPGGCVIEGSYGTNGYYNWEDSVGPLEKRHAIGSYWGTEGHPVNYTPGYGYMMSYQFGFHEIFSLCEKLGAEPLPIMSAGIFCQFRRTAESKKGDELEEFAKHATNLIDYCWGSVDSTDPTQAAWAKKRTENGHAEPFTLNYIGIGNENWNDPAQGISYKDNFLWIKNYIDKYVKAHYPERKITLISSTGPYYVGGQNGEAWTWINQNVPGETLVDEHYYINYAGDSNNTLLSGDYVYDGYKRLKDGGSNVFVGEYAGHLNATTENVLDTAISEAAYITGLERNADIVRHASYAPLFEREGCRDWDYNLIKFDAYNSYGTPSYYVQTMCSNNYGDHIINTTLEKYNTDKKAYDEKPGHQTELYYVTSEDDDYIYTKLVNHADYEKAITLHYNEINKSAQTELICLSGNSMDLNTMANPEKIVPKTTQTALADGALSYQVPAMSLTIVKVKKGTDAPEPTPATADFSKLNAAITEAAALKEADYTAETWKLFAEALAAAKTVAATEDATQAEVDDANTALTSAQAALKKPQPAPVPKPTPTNEVINADGSKTTTETKNNADGSTTKTETTTAKDGTVKKTVTTEQKNGTSTVTDSVIKNGSETSTETSQNAKKEVTRIVTTTKKAGKVTDSKTYKVSGTKATLTKATDAKTISIGTTVTAASGKSFKITAIGANAFKGSKKLTKITLGKNITSIGKSAFQNAKKLKTIIIKGKIKKIEKNAFKGIKKKAAFKIKAGKKDYKKIVKLLKKYGKAKKAKYKRV